MFTSRPAPGIPAVTKSSSSEHLKEDLDLWSWNLTTQDVPSAFHMLGMVLMPHIPRMSPADKSINIMLEPDSFLKQILQRYQLLQRVLPPHVVPPGEAANGCPPQPERVAILCMQCSGGSACLAQAAEQIFARRVRRAERPLVIGAELCIFECPNSLCHCNIFNLYQHSQWRPHPATTWFSSKQTISQQFFDYPAI